MIELLVAAALLPGFNRTPALEPAASFVAGKPVAVYCAKTTPAWQAFLTENGEPITANGSSEPGSSSVFLAPAACTNLRSGQPFFYKGLAPAVLVLTHESIHARGETDEAKTDCAAVHEMPRVAVKFFGVTAGKALRKLMAEAWAYRKRGPALYRAVC